MENNGPSSATSPEGRRVLVALVTGELGRRIQEWRLRNDPVQAERIPPHATLCYWVPDLAEAELGAQVVHAFPAGISVLLNNAAFFESGEQSMYLPIVESVALDEARRRLYDRTACDLGQQGEWPWHVTCVRDSRGRDRSELSAASTGLPSDARWEIDTVACLELRGARYIPIHAWNLAS